MKKFIALTAALLLTATITSADELCEADEKWLEVVSSLVRRGHTTISTPIEERAEMLKKWAGESGYAVQVIESGDFYHLELFKQIASN